MWKPLSNTYNYDLTQTFLHSIFSWRGSSVYTDVKVHTQIWKRNTFWMLYKTSHEKFVMGLQKNLKPTAVTMTLPCIFFKSTPIPSLSLTVNVQLGFLGFVFFFAWYIYLASHIQNLFLFAFLREKQQRSSLTCLAFHREYTLPLANFGDGAGEGKFWKIIIWHQSVMPEKARKKAHSSQVLSLTCNLLH